MTIEQLAQAILQAARARAGDDGAVMIEVARLILTLLQAIQTQAQQAPDYPGDGWLSFVRVALPDDKKK